MNTILSKIAFTAILALLLTVSAAQPAMAKDSESTSAVTQAISVNLNTANAKEIAKALKGIGLKKAEAIVAYRQSHGDFKAVEELASVKGIGVATIAKNHDRIALK